MLKESALFHFISFFSSLMVCCLRIAGGTFLRMRLNHLRGPTPPVLMGTDDRQRDDKSDIQFTNKR